MTDMFERISFDLDGVLFNSPALIERVIESDYELDGPLWTTYDINETAHPSHVKKAVINCFKDPITMVERLAIPELQELKSMTSYSKIYIISSRRLHRDATIEKIKSLIYPHAIEGIVFTDGRGTKYTAMNGLNIDLHVDDDPLECGIIASKSMCKPVLYKRCYNTWAEKETCIPFVSNLKELVERIRMRNI